MRLLLIAMLVLGTGLGFLGRLVRIRTGADRQLELIRHLEERGFNFHGYRRGPLEWYESLVYAIDRRTPFIRVSKVTLPAGETGANDLAKVAALPGLQILIDFHGKCTDSDLEEFASCPTLTSVTIANSKCTARGAKALFQGKASLVQAALTSVQVDDEFLKIASRSRRLESLTIEGGGVTAKGIAELKHSNSLLTLTIQGGTNLGSGLAAVNENSQLNQLWLRNYRFAENEIADFASLHSLKSLNIECEAFPQGALQAIGSGKRLEALRLAGAFSSNERVQAFACTNLKRLQIDDLAMPPEQFFDALAKLPHLTHLNLPKLNVGAKDLDRLPHCPALRELTIHSGGVAVESINRLQKRSPACSVTLAYPDGRVFRYPAGGGSPELVKPGR